MYYPRPVENGKWEKVKEKQELKQPKIF